MNWINRQRAEVGTEILNFHVRVTCTERAFLEGEGWEEDPLSHIPTARFNAHRQAVRERENGLGWEENPCRDQGAAVHRSSASRKTGDLRGLHGRVLFPTYLHRTASTACSLTVYFRTSRNPIK